MVQTVNLQNSTDVRGTIKRLTAMIAKQVSRMRAPSADIRARREQRCCSGRHWHIFHTAPSKILWHGARSSLSWSAPEGLSLQLSWGNERICMTLPIDLGPSSLFSKRFSPPANWIVAPLCGASFLEHGSRPWLKLDRNGITRLTPGLTTCQGEREKDALREKSILLNGEPAEVLRAFSRNTRRSHESALYSLYHYRSAFTSAVLTRFYYIYINTFVANESPNFYFKFNNRNFTVNAKTNFGTFYDSKATGKNS